MSAARYSTRGYDCGMEVARNGGWVSYSDYAQLEDTIASLREQLAAFMIRNSFTTGHGDTFADLLSELEWQVRERSASNEALRVALRDVRSAIVEASPAILTDTLWLPERISPNETAVDRIDAALARIAGTA